jgi:hypothetical protein
LAAAAEKERGPPQQPYLKELAKREGGKELILKQLLRTGDDEVRARLKSDEAKVRLQEVEQVAARKLRYGEELIGLLSDGDEAVRHAAHRALVQMAGGRDFGATAERWRSWWEKEQRP